MSEAKASRWFVYADGTKCVVGEQTVVYNPDGRKDVYRSCVSTTCYPGKTRLANGFSLSMFPKLNTEHPEQNIESETTAICRLFDQANRQSHLRICSLLDIPREKFKWNYLRVFDKSDLYRELDDDYQSDRWYDKKAVLTAKGYPVLKGDIVFVGDVADLDDGFTHHWDVEYRSSDNKFGIFSCFRKLWYKLFNKKLYDLRYKGSGTFRVKLDDLKFIDGGTVVSKPKD